MYNLEKAANYWGNERMHGIQDLTEAVAYLNVPDYINNAYTAWESAIILNCIHKYSLSQLLDVACGVGRFTSLMASCYQVTKLYAVDIATEMLTKCKESIATINQLNKVEFICSDSTSFHVPSFSIEGVVCFGLFEHLPLDYQYKTLETICNTLKARGVLLLEINNNKSIFLKKNNDNAFRKSTQLDNGYYCGLVDVNKIVDKITSLGMKIIHTYYNPFFSLLSHLFRDSICHNDISSHGKKWMEMANRLDQWEYHEIKSKLSDQIIFEIVKL